MLLYIFLDHTSLLQNRLTTAREKKSASAMLISFGIFLLAILIAESICYGFFAYGWFVCSSFGLFSMWVFVRLAMRNKIKEIKILTLVTLGALCIGAYSGAAFLEEESARNIIRDLTAGGGQNIWLERDALRSGVGGFGFVYSIGLLAPALLYAGICAKNWIFRIFCWVSCYIFSIYSYRAGFSILIASAVYGYVCYLTSFVIPNFKRYRTVMRAIIIFILAATLFPKIVSFGVSPLSTLAYSLENDNYTSRLLSIAEGISGGSDEYALYRTGLMWKSWRVFLQHPFIGAANTSLRYEIGGHSFFFDHLAMSGLLGFLPYPIFIYFYSRYLKLVLYPVSRRAQILISTYVYMFFLCTFLNPLNSLIVWSSLFLLLPGISLFFSDVKINGKVNEIQKNTP
jgi:hypothetical protein